MKVDLTNLSPEAALVKLRAAFDEHIAAAMERSEIMLRDHGATDEEVGAALTWSIQECIATRERFLAQLLRSISEPHAPSARLQ